MDIKDSGYLISNYNIQSNHKSFDEIINKGFKISQDLDNKKYIDKKFDETMINLKKNYSNVLKYMKNKREEKFPLE